MRRILIAGTVVCLAASPLAQRPTPVAYGVGTAACRDWKTPQQGEDRAQISWVMGYLSAAGVPNRTPHGDELSEGYVHGFMAAVCGVRPGDTIVQAAAALVGNLKGQ